jgi:putative transposase
MRYRFIETHKKVWPITLMCNVLNVSSSGFYEWGHRRPSRRAIANDRLDGHIRQVFDQHKQRYGAPRIVDEINGHGQSCSKNRVARRMRVMGIQAIQRKSSRSPPTRTTTSRSPRI